MKNIIHLISSTSPMSNLLSPFSSLKLSTLIPSISTKKTSSNTCFHLRYLLTHHSEKTQATHQWKHQPKHAGNPRRLDGRRSCILPTQRADTLFSLELPSRILIKVIFFLKRRLPINWRHLPVDRKQILRNLPTKDVKLHRSHCQHLHVGTDEKNGRKDFGKACVQLEPHHNAFFAVGFNR